MIDPTDAPEGFIAVQAGSPGLCFGCHFYDHRSTFDVSPCYPCDAVARKDRQSVVFHKKAGVYDPIEAVTRDAKRYRWIRSIGFSNPLGYNLETLDAYIDERMQDG